MPNYTSIERDALLSSCESYRYRLSRLWNHDDPVLLFIGLNPSTGDAMQDDRTIMRLIQFTSGWGYGGFYLGNLFAFRARRPANMFAQI